MKTKHTPGPWNVVCIEGLSDWAFLGVGSEKSTKAVCHIHFEATIENNKVIIPEECKANAQLIAAAPEMLEALETIKSMCDGNKDNENNIWHIANKAIKKAIDKFWEEELK